MDKAIGMGDNGRWVDNSGYPPPKKVVSVYYIANSSWH